MTMTVGAEAKVARKQHKAPCHDCPWRRASIPGWLGPYTIEEWLQVAHGEGRIECHTVKQFDDDGWQCAGAAIYRANVIKQCHDPEILALPKDLKKVFWFGEFKAHHEKANP